MQAVPDLLEQEAAEWDPDMRGLLAELAACEGGLPELAMESSPSAELGSKGKSWKLFRHLCLTACQMHAA